MKKSVELFNNSVVMAQKELQAAISDRNSSIAILTEKREALKKAIDECNEEIRNEYYAEFLATDNAFLTAIKQEFICVYSSKEKKDSKTNQVEIVVDSKKELVNLIALEAASLDKQLANNGQWIYWVEKFAYVVGARATKEVGGNLDKFKNAFKLSSAATGCDIGATPTSNNQMLKQLQTIIDGIIFIDNGKGQNELKALTSDVARIIYTCCKDARDSNNIITPRKDTMTRLIVKAINRIATNGTYEAE